MPGLLGLKGAAAVRKVRGKSPGLNPGGPLELSD